VAEHNDSSGRAGDVSNGFPRGRPRSRGSESPWHNGVVSEEPRPAKSSVAVATALVLLGLLIALLSLAPWVRTSSVGGGGENLTGVGLSNSGWLVFAAGALVAATGAVILATRRPIVAVIAMWLLRLGRRSSLTPLRSASA
jgi:hypothetical protein